MINRCELGDEEVEYILKTDVELTERFGSGFLEDIVPYMTKFYTTQRWNELVDETNKLLAIFDRLIKEHEDTFDPGKEGYICTTIINFIAMLLKTFHIYIT